LTLAPSSRPRIAPKARLRWDEREQRYFLLYPERGLRLSPSAGEILRRCDGEWSIAEIARELQGLHPGAEPSTIQEDVLKLLSDLIMRGLVEF
jgi:pyrroloquinoline quinone biosynthesis protein D